MTGHVISGRITANRSYEERCDPERCPDSSARSQDHLEQGLPGSEHLALRTGYPAGSRPGSAGGVPNQQAAGLPRRSRRAAAWPDEPQLQPGPPRRFRRAATRGHVGRSCRRACGTAAATDRRPRHAPGKTRQVKGERGRYNVIYAYYDESVGFAAGELAVRLINDLIVEDPDFDFDQELESFIVRGERTAFGPSTQAIVEEAVSRDIPYLRLNTASLVQLGQGVHQKRIRATMTSQTPSVAVDIASIKELTLSLLSAAGLPVPRSQSVRTVDDAVRLANRIGYPVVLKPLDGNHGRGVMLDLRSDAD